MTAFIIVNDMHRQSAHHCFVLFFLQCIQLFYFFLQCRYLFFRVPLSLTAILRMPHRQGSHALNLKHARTHIHTSHTHHTTLAHAHYYLSTMHVAMHTTAMDDTTNIMSLLCCTQLPLPLILQSLQDLVLLPIHIRTISL